MYLKLKDKIGTTGIVTEDYGGYEIKVRDNERFPWADVFFLLLDSGFQIWIDKYDDDDSQIQVMVKPEVN